jgi:hypothetical protein
VTEFLLALHVVFAIFAVGPLVYAATTAGRGDAAAAASSARLLRIYGAASALVVITGMVLMYRPRYPDGIGWYSYSSGPPSGVLYALANNHIGEFGQTWIWLSLALWAVAIVLIFALVVPTLNRATRTIGAGEPAGALTGRVAAAGGVIGLIFVAITVLMVYRPGS